MVLSKEYTLQPKKIKTDIHLVVSGNTKYLTFSFHTKELQPSNETTERNNTPSLRKNPNFQQKEPGDTEI